MKTLEELKKENLETEAKAKADKDATNQQLEVVTDEEDNDETENEVEELEASENTEESKDWLNSDNEENNANTTMPVSAHIKLKAKLKDKLSEKDQENEQLKQRIAELEKGITAPTQAIKLPPRPKLEDFNFDEEKYQQALDQWDEQRIEAKLEQMTAKNKQATSSKTFMEEVNRKVEEHYKRAEQVAKKSGITEEQYRDADLNFKRVIEKVFPNRGELIADQLISKMGEGSEKVAYFIGVNKRAQIEFENILKSDPSGVEAAIYLGRKVSEFSPKRTATNAPTPATQISGDAKANLNGEAKRYKAEYDKAHKAGNVQKVMDVKREAKAKGVNVANW